ncbi:flavin reductase family protein [Massilia sp. TSP1-1-2]|uniref:flavin reductase family protein n=1 Tax=Massilia sp. TSP1-1-2 TaxID=2804649 RepID=UPI003CE8EFF1
MSAPTACGSAPEFATKQFRQALSQFATGVTVITARQADGEPIGVTSNSFNAVSFEPPLVLWSLAHAAGSMAGIAAGDGYVVNVLAGDQIDLAQRFALADPGLFGALPFALSRRGLPILPGCVAWFECRHRSRYTEAEHVIFVGEVESCHSHPQRTLGFHRGRFIAL